MGESVIKFRGVCANPTPRYIDQKEVFAIWDYGKALKPLVWWDGGEHEARRYGGLEAFIFGS